MRGSFRPRHFGGDFPSTELTRAYYCPILPFGRKEGLVQARVGARPEQNGCTVACRGESARCSLDGVELGSRRELTVAEAVLWTEMCGRYCAIRRSDFEQRPLTFRPPHAKDGGGAQFLQVHGVVGGCVPVHTHVRGCAPATVKTCRPRDRRGAGRCRGSGVHKGAQAQGCRLWPLFGRI